MKILLATYWYLPHTGGVHTYLQVLRQGLEKRGHQVDLIAHHPDMNHVYRLTDGTQIPKKPILYPLYDMMMDYFRQELPALDDWARFRDIERYVFELAAVLLGTDRYDLIHTQDVISTRALARVKPAGTPLVATIHGLLMDEFFVTGDIEREGSNRWKYSFVEEHLGAASPDFTILPTEWLRREYTNRFFVPPEKLTVIPYGINTEQLVRATSDIKRIPRADGKLALICPARLVPYKGQRYLLEALAALRRVRDDFVCLFAGDGPQRSELQDLVEKWGLQEHAQFLGNRNDLHLLLKQSDLFVLPTLVENHSLAVMEAQVIGLPVITTRVGGNGELITHRHNGMLVEPQSGDALCQAILQLMNDPALRDRLSQTSQTWARKYWHADRMVERTLEVYAKAVKK